MSRSSKTKRFGAAVAASGTALALLAGAAGAAGAADWPPPADGYVDLMVDRYPAAPGHGDSIHATCWDADGDGHGDGYELGLHPWDEVARSWQVYDSGGTLLANVSAPIHLQTFRWDEEPVRIRYAGADYALVGRDEASARCPAPPTTTSTMTSTTTSTVPVTTPGTTPSTVPVTTPATVPPTTTVPPSTTSTSTPPATVSSTTADPAALQVAAVSVLGARVQRQLPATGASSADRLRVAGFLMAAGGLLVLGTRRARAERTA